MVIALVTLPTKIELLNNVLVPVPPCATGNIPLTILDASKLLMRPIKILLVDAT